MRGKGGALCAAWMALLVSTACAQEDDLRALGRAVAQAVDTTNGHPVLVLDEYWSSSDRSPSRAEAMELAAGFADELGVPATAERQFDSPPCRWALPLVDKPRGLWAQFSPPEVKGDSTLINLTTGCAKNENEAFRQVHEFVLVRTASGDWKVVARRLMMIT